MPCDLAVYSITVDPNMQAIDEVIQADITTVACILNINSDLAECLLSDCSWDMEKLLNVWFESYREIYLTGIFCTRIT